MELRSLPSSASFPRTLRTASALIVSLAILSGAALTATEAQASAKVASATTEKKKPARARAAKAAAAAAAVPVAAVAAADAQQMSAMQRVNEGVSLCEFNQQVSVTASQQYPGYVDLSFKKKRWLMKPVLSSTGALRLEDVAGETLFIQIRNKSMLMNQKNGQRLVDGCVHPRQQASAH